MKRMVIAVSLFVLATVGVGSPALANHGKRCTVAVHHGPVKVFADCHQH